MQLGTLDEYSLSVPREEIPLRLQDPSLHKWQRALLEGRLAC